ncbi:hypothetical protein [Neorhizobium petrolearium]|uniref:hypothetical protein n=1 Tax=Neorhizobium petrolearium TaxID=515361 RepID=UPI003F7E367B
MWGGAKHAADLSHCGRGRKIQHLADKLSAGFFRRGVKLPPGGVCGGEVSMQRWRNANRENVGLSHPHSAFFRLLVFEGATFFSTLEVSLNRSNLLERHSEKYVIALGSNEVPKAGGGTYWPDEDFDDREFRRKIDSNDKRKAEILEDVVRKLGLSWDNLSEEQKENLLDSSFMDALEYGRIVHAEMSAISDAARLRGALRDARDCQEFCV